MRLIDADAFKEYIKGEIDGLILPADQAEKIIAIKKSFLKDIDKQPTINRRQDIVIPVATIKVDEEKINKAIERARPHGEWIESINDNICSSCKQNSLTHWKSPFCPCCGAKMEGGDL